MGRLELLDNLQDVVAQVQVRQENLDEVSYTHKSWRMVAECVVQALQLHNEEVEKIIGAAKEPRQATINH